MVQTIERSDSVLGTLAVFYSSSLPLAFAWLSVTIRAVELTLIGSDVYFPTMCVLISVIVFESHLCSWCELGLFGFFVLILECVDLGGVSVTFFH